MALSSTRSASGAVGGSTSAMSRRYDARIASGRVVVTPTSRRRTSVRAWLRAVASCSMSQQVSPGLRSRMFHELWHDMIIHYSNEYPDIMRLVAIALLIPTDVSASSR